jgi:peptidase E
LVFLSGGSKTGNLLKEIKANPKLEQLIRNVAYIIGESAGSKVL